MAITPDDVLSSLEDLDREARIRALRAALAEVEQENARKRYPTPGHMAADLEPTTVQTPALELIDREVAVCIRDGGRLIISVPPQEGKSTRVAVWTPVWALMRNPDLRIVVASYAESLARRNAMQARALVQAHGSGAIDDVTGEALPDRLGLRVAYDHRRANSWAIQGHTGGYYATGVSGALTGRAAELLIIDDPVKNQQQADSAREREKVWEWWTAVANTRLAPGAAVIVIMTRWHEDDLAGGIIAADRKLPPEEREWRVVNIPAVAEAGVPDALERAEGEPLVSARNRTGEDFRRIKRTVGPRVWGALYQGQPTPSDGGLFSGEEIDRSRVPEAGIIGRVVTVDPAESGHGDEAGLLVMGWDDTSTIYVEEDHSGQMTSAAWSRTAVETALRTGAGEILYEAFTAKETYRNVLEAAWRDIERQADLLRSCDRDALVAAEKWHNEGNEGDSLGFMQRTLEILDRIPPGRGAPFTITPWRAPGDKVARAAGARQAVSTGRLRMIGEHPVLERQARTWQVGQGSPDRVDAMVNGYEHISGIIGNSGFEIESPWE